ncbi:Adenylate cyclase type 10 [Rhizophlyctis rosea]|uniref:Adenylate cyclase type 10 n=1 Tax=Rhizophlyctis rosea TaxID=64517 RepID=A0AAD5SNC7_9FUNG|nr:Adenylate cyclase type 10 [Rhizophlyctis rosea]
MTTVVPRPCVMDASMLEHDNAFDADSEHAATLSAILCCFEILEEFRNYIVAIPSTEEPSTPPMTHAPPSISMNPAQRRLSITSNFSGPGTPKGARRLSMATSLGPSPGSGRIRTSKTSMAPRTQPFELKIHISIGCGAFSSLHVGRAGSRTEFFVAGPAADDAMMNLVHAKPGEVALSADCWARLHYTLDAWEVSNPSLGETYIPPSPEWYGTEVKGSGGGCYVIKDSAEDLARISFALSGSDNTNDPDVNNEERFFPEEEQRITDYIHESLAKALFESTGDLEHGMHNTIRNVCIVFVRLPITSTAGNVGQVLRKTQKVMCIALDAVRRYEGTIRQFNFDDKGATVLLVWGVEGYTHERGDASFALHAALQIKDELMIAIGDGFSIGVSEGPVFSGVIGNSARSDGTVLGVAVNTAARLMCHPKAMGTVLCTEPLKKECEESVEFDKGEYVNLKVLVFRAIQTKSSTESEKGSDRKCKGKILAGRMKEMKLIDDCIENWQAGKTARLVLSSSSGLGKTALGGYLLCRITDLEDSVICEGRSSETHRSAPFHALRVVLSNLFDEIHTRYVDTGILEYRVLEAETSRSSLSLSRHSLESANNVGMPSWSSFARSNPKLNAIEPKEKWDQIVPNGHSAKTVLAKKVTKVLMLLKESTRTMMVLNQVLEIHQQERTNLPTSVPGASYIVVIASAVARILNKLSMYLRINVCFLFEDVQWQDNAGFDVLCDLIKRCPKILFCITSRPIEEYTNDHLCSSYKKVIQAEPTTLIELTPMDQKAMAELVKLRFNVAKIEPQLAKLLYKQSSGNPMIVELLCNDMVSRREVEIESGELRRSFALSQTQAKDSVMPVDIRSAVAAQVDRVPGFFKQILRVASVAGQFFSVSEICTVLSDLQPPSADSPWSSTKTLLEYIGQADKLNMLVVASCEGNLLAAESGLTPSSSAAADSPDMSGRGRRSSMRRFALSRPSSFDKHSQDTISFRHYFLQQCIYAALLPEHRESLHSAFAAFYERTLSRANKFHHLPLLIYHLERIPGDGKRKLKWGEYAFLYFAEETRHVDLGIQAYGKLEKLMHQYPEEIDFDMLTLAKHHRLLALLHDQKWDAASSIQECIFALDLLDMSLPDPKSFKAFWDVFLGVCIQKRLKTMPEQKREQKALQNFKRFAHYHHAKPPRWPRLFRRNVVTHIHDISLPHPTFLTRTDEDAALRMQAIETMEVGRIMLQQLTNLERTDWRFLLIIGCLNFSSAVIRERPLQEGIWKMLFAGHLLKQGWPKVAADYVASAMAIMDKFDRSRWIEQTKNEEDITDRDSNSSTNVRIGAEPVPSHIAAEKLLLQHSYTIYLFTVGSWGTCERVSQQLHEAYENIASTSTPSARLNLVVLAYMLFVQGKHLAWIDALRLNHTLAGEVDAGYHWGRHLACDIAAALAATGIDNEADSWYGTAKEDQGEKTHFHNLFHSSCMLRYELVQLQKARLDDDVQKWAQIVLSTARELLGMLETAKIMTNNQCILNEFTCRFIKTFRRIVPRRSASSNGGDGTRRPSISLASEAAKTKMRYKTAATKCANEIVATVEAYRANPSLTPYLGALVISRAARAQGAFGLRTIAVRKIHKPTIPIPAPAIIASHRVGSEVGSNIDGKTKDTLHKLRGTAMNSVSSATSGIAGMHERDGSADVEKRMRSELRGILSRPRTADFRGILGRGGPTDSRRVAPMNSLSPTGFNHTGIPANATMNCMWAETVFEACEARWELHVLRKIMYGHDPVGDVPDQILGPRSLD